MRHPAARTALSGNGAGGALGVQGRPGTGPGAGASPVPAASGRPAQTHKSAQPSPAQASARAGLKTQQGQAQPCLAAAALTQSQEGARPPALIAQPVPPPQHQNTPVARALSMHNALQRPSQHPPNFMPPCMGVQSPHPLRTPGECAPSTCASTRAHGRFPSSSRNLSPAFPGRGTDPAPSLAPSPAPPGGPGSALSRGNSPGRVRCDGKSRWARRCWKSTGHALSPTGKWGDPGTGHCTPGP